MAPLSLPHAATPDTDEGVALDADVSAVATIIEELVAAPSRKARRGILERGGALLQNQTAYLLVTVLLAQVRHNHDRAGARALRPVAALLRRNLGGRIPASWSKPLGFGRRLPGAWYTQRAEALAGALEVIGAVEPHSPPSA